MQINPKPHIWINILFLTELFQTKFMISAMTLIFTFVSKFSSFRIGMYPVLPLTEFTFLNLFDLLECVVI